MATLNVKSAPTHRTQEGAPAKRISPEQELRRTVLSCLLWEDEYYESGQSIATRILALAERVSAETVAAVAIEARSVQHLRHVPLLLADALAKSPEPSRRKMAESVLARVIQRPDELTEFLSIYWRQKRQPLAASVKRGLATAFGKFNAYSLAKYNRDGKVKLKDVLRLCHAKPKDAEQSALWKALLTDTLPTPDTWEVALSSGADKKATWERLIAEEKLGGLAMLRNLRNMQTVGVEDAAIRQGLQALKAERVLPFRFLAAATYAPRFEPELEQAMFRNTADLPKLPGKTTLLIDASGSMAERLSGKSDLTRFSAAAGLAILLREVCATVEVIRFNSTPSIVPARRGFALRDALGAPDGGTHTETAKLYADGLGYDRLIILTDEQSHQALSAPKGKGYVINVASYQNGVGYGTWTHIDGWSEGVVRYLQSLEA